MYDVKHLSHRVRLRYLKLHARYSQFGIRNITSVPDCIRGKIFTPHYYSIRKLACVQTAMNGTKLGFQSGFLRVGSFIEKCLLNANPRVPLQIRCYYLNNSFRLGRAGFLCDTHALRSMQTCTYSL
jgi:hypothetical protein